jgi:hypothetical protein
MQIGNGIQSHILAVCLTREDGLGMDYKLKGKDRDGIGTVDGKVDAARPWELGVLWSAALRHQFLAGNDTRTSCACLQVHLQS